MIKIFLDLFSRETWESVKLSKILEVTWVLWTVVCPCVLVTRVCLTLWDPTACSPPGSSVHRILQARILEWVTIAFSRGSSPLSARTQVSCIVGRFFTVWITREAHKWLCQHVNPGQLDCENLCPCQLCFIKKSVMKWWDLDEAALGVTETLQY